MILHSEYSKWTAFPLKDENILIIRKHKNWHIQNTYEVIVFDSYTLNKNFKYSQIHVYTIIVEIKWQHVLYILLRKRILHLSKAYKYKYSFKFHLVQIYLSSYALIRKIIECIKISPFFQHLRTNLALRISKKIFLTVGTSLRSFVRKFLLRGYLKSGGV